ncbi:hypothetical protein ACJJTC_001448 [Scirpophaga incertulas]
MFFYELLINLGEFRYYTLDSRIFFTPPKPATYWSFEVGIKEKSGAKKNYIIYKIYIVQRNLPSGRNIAEFYLCNIENGLKKGAQKAGKREVCEYLLVIRRKTQFHVSRDATNKSWWFRSDAGEARGRRASRTLQRFGAQCQH